MEEVGVLAFKVPGHPIVHGGKERRRSTPTESGTGQVAFAGTHKAQGPQR